MARSDLYLGCADGCISVWYAVRHHLHWYAELVPGHNDQSYRIHRGPPAEDTNYYTSEFGDYSAENLQS